MPDPKIQPVIDELLAVLKKHDLAGTVVASSKTHTQYAYELSPSWSCAKMKRDKEGRSGVHIHALRSEFASPEAHRECVRLTTSLIMGLIDVANKNEADMTQVAEMLSCHFGITHVSWEERLGRTL